jgi:hypothetical protein
VVNGATADAEEVRHLRDGAAVGHLEDGQGSAVNAGIGRGLQLLSQPLPLPQSQMQLAHGSPHPGSVPRAKRVGPFIVTTHLDLPHENPTASEERGTPRYLTAWGFARSDSNEIQD